MNRNRLKAFPFALFLPDRRPEELIIFRNMRVGNDFFHALLTSGYINFIPILILSGYPILIFSGYNERFLG